MGCFFVPTQADDERETQRMGNENVKVFYLFCQGKHGSVLFQGEWKQKLEEFAGLEKE